MSTTQENSRYICLNCRQQHHGNCIGEGCDCICKELRVAHLSPHK